MNQHYISIRHLSKKFSKDFVLKDVNAELGKGEILGFLGPSGAGQTTTIKTPTGQLRPTSGEPEVLSLTLPGGEERSLVICQKLRFTPKGYPRHGGTILKHPL